MNIRLVTTTDSKLLSKYYMENEKHFEKWEPIREPDFHSESEWVKRLSERVTEQKEGKAAYFIAVEEKSSEIIAHCSLTNICYGAFRAGYLGYGIDKKFEGRGIMSQVCNKAIEHAFTSLSLNRVMANYMPHNKRSASLLKNLEFTIEGEAKNYLKINGVWEDHVLTALVNPKYM